MKNIDSIKEINFSHAEHFCIFGNLITEKNKEIKWELCAKNAPESDMWTNPQCEWSPLEVYEILPHLQEMCVPLPPHQDEIYKTAIEASLKENNYYRSRWEESFQNWENGE